MKKTIVLTFALSIISVFALSSEIDNIKAGDWHYRDADLMSVAHALAREVSTSSQSVAFVVEGWGWLESHYLDIQNDAETNKPIGVHRYNPNMPRFDIDARGKTLSAVLDEIVGKHGSYTWIYDPRHRVVGIIEKHLLDDSRWPLNWPLGAQGQTPMTFMEAHQALYGNFLHNKGGNPPSKVSLLGWSDQASLVWKPENESSSAKARDLVYALIRTAFRPKKLYEAIMFSGFDTRLGYEGLKMKRELPWGLSFGTAKDDEQILKRLTSFGSSMGSDGMR